jgi:hypothetical protein
MTTHPVEALYRTQFAPFVRFALGELRPKEKFQPNWHIDVVIDRLKRIIAGEPLRMAVNMPPRNLKSLVCSLALPAFLAGNDPTKQIMLIVGGDGLAQEFADKLATLMGGKRYRALFPHMRMTWTKRSVSFGHGGFIRIVTVGRALSGRGADLVIIDDPISPSQASDPANRQKVNDWYRKEVLTRSNDGKIEAILLVMQRVNGEDLSGFVKRNDPSFEQLVLPAIAVAPESWRLDDGRVFTRNRGDLLHAERTDINALLRMLDRMNGVDFCLQQLQAAYMPRTYADKEHFHEFLWMPRPEGWTAPAPLPPFGQLTILSKEYVLRDVFGIAPPEPVPVPERPVTEEEIQISAAEHQRLLVEGKPYFGIENPDTTHAFETRGSLYGRKLNAIFKSAYADQFTHAVASK